MTDLISKDKVLRCLKESSEQIDWGQSEDGDAFKHYIGATYCTIAEFKPEQPQWISVKDRLPEQAGYKCLVAAKFIDGKYVRFTAFTGYGEPGWWTYETVYMEKAPNNKVHHNFTVTHWMSLPEPPEVKQND